MDTKKWPVLVQVIIGFGCISGARDVLAGFAIRDILSIILGLCTVILFWNFYKFQAWALTGLNVLISLAIVLILISILGGVIPPVLGIILITIRGAILYYLNSRQVKDLLQTGKSSLPS